MVVENGCLRSFWIRISHPDNFLTLLLFAYRKVVCTGKQITVAGCYEGSKQKDGFCRDVKKEDITYKNKKHPKTVEGKVCFCNKYLCNGELTDTWTVT